MGLEDDKSEALGESLVAIGRHGHLVGVGDPTGTTTYFNQYFGVSHFTGRSYYGGHYGANNDNHYALFSASGLDFISAFSAIIACINNAGPGLGGSRAGEQLPRFV